MFGNDSAAPTGLRSVLSAYPAHGRHGLGLAISPLRVVSKSPNGAGIPKPGVKPRKRKREKQEPQRGGINQPGVKPRERKREKQ